MTVQIFLDSPDLKAYERHKHVISGGTTNPSLLSRVGIPPEKYEEHSRAILEILGAGVLSVEVTEVLPSKMLEQAMKFFKWGERIVVKIPSPFYIEDALAKRVQGSDFAQEISSSPLNAVEEKNGRLYVDTIALIARLAQEGVPLNVTCGFAFEQAHDIASAIGKGASKAAKPAKTNFFSIFWGRILDRYAADKSLAISESYNANDFEKMLAWASAEVLDTGRQLEGSSVRVILGSCRMPKVWETAAKQEGGEKIRMLQREAYRAVLKAAQPINAVPTIPPALIEAARFNDSTADAVKGFVDDFLKLKEKG